MVRICPKCGARNVDSLDSCGACGSHLNKEPAELTTEERWDRVLMTGDRPGESSSYGPDVDSDGAVVKSLRMDLLRGIIGPALTLAAIIYVVGVLWAEELAKTPFDRITQRTLDCIRLAGYMGEYGIMAFVLLTVIAIYILTTESKR